MGICCQGLALQEEGVGRSRVGGWGSSGVVVGGEWGPHPPCIPAGIQVLFASALRVEVEKQ